MISSSSSSDSISLGMVRVSTLTLALGSKVVRRSKVFMAEGPDAMTRDWPGRGQARWISKSILIVDCLFVEKHKSYGRLRCHLNQNPFAGDDEGTLAALFVLERAGLILSGMNE